MEGDDEERVNRNQVQKWEIKAYAHRANIADLAIRAQWHQDFF